MCRLVVIVAVVLTVQSAAGVPVSTNCVARYQRSLNETVRGSQRVMP